MNYRGFKIKVKKSDGKLIATINHKKFPEEIYMEAEPRDTEQSLLDKVKKTIDEDLIRGVGGE